MAFLELNRHCQSIEGKKQEYWKESNAIAAANNTFIYAVVLSKSCGLHDE